jgi:hypothetical protein
VLSQTLRVSLPHRPSPKGDQWRASGHCRRHFERLMDANKIVVHGEERDGAGVVLDLL